MIPFRLMFWNMGRTATPEWVARLAKEHHPDIVILAESNHGLGAMVEALRLGCGLIYEIPFDLESRIQFLTKLPASHLMPIYEGKYISIKRIQPVIGKDFLLVAAHLPSKLRLDAQEQADLCKRWIRDISHAEAKTGHHRTVVIGDFNMNPFEQGIVGSEGFHAISSRRIVAKGSRTVHDEERLFFYNPMWSMMGDHSDLPGTYYYASGKPITYFWNTFEQVLLRPAFAQYYIPGDVAVLAEAGARNLLNSNGIPDSQISDHLPILATLRLEETSNGN